MKLFGLLCNFFEILFESKSFLKNYHPEWWQFLESVLAAPFP